MRSFLPPLAALALSALVSTQPAANQSDFSFPVNFTQLSKQPTAISYSQPLFSHYLQQHPFTVNQVFTLQLSGFSSAVKIAADSKPSEGFYRLESLASDTGRTYHLGYIKQLGDRTFSVLKLPHQPKIEIIEYNGTTSVRLAESIPSQPLIPEQNPPTKDNANSAGISSAAADNSPANEVSIAVPESQSTIDVLLMFDPRLPSAYVDRAQPEFYDLTTRISAASDYTNAVFQRSGLDVTHNIVGLVPFQPPTPAGEEFPYESSSDVLSTIYYSKEAVRLKDRYQADMIHYIGAEDPGVCGRAYLANSISPDNAFELVNFQALVAYSRLPCIGAGTYAHELGHNLGFNHDRITLGGDSIGQGGQDDFHIPYGYVEPAGEFYTTMAYGSSCTGIENGGQCLDEAVYSSPDIFLDDLPMGVDETEQDAANNTKAGGLTAPVVARLDSYARMQPLSLLVTGDSEVNISWPALDGAVDYRILSGNCDSREYYFASTLDEANILTTNQAVFSSDSAFADSSCIYARFENDAGSPSYALIGQSSLSVALSGFGDDYLYTDTNIFDAFRQGDEQTFTVTLSNDSTPNSAIRLALPEAGDGSLNTRLEGLVAAEEWFNYQVTGSGTERTLVISLAQDVDDIADSLSDTDERNPYKLPIRIVNTEFGEYTVYNTVWLDPQGTLPAESALYYNSAIDLKELEPVSGEMVILNLAESDQVSVNQTSAIQLENFTYSQSYAEAPYGNQTIIQFSGEVPVLDDPSLLELEVTSSSPEFAGQVVFYNLVPRVIPPQITSVEGNVVVVGDAADITVFVEDDDNNINWATGIMDVTVGQTEAGDDVIETYNPVSNDPNAGTVSFSVADLDIGEYPFTVSISDVEGSQASQSNVIIVQENEAPVFNDISVNSSTVLETRPFTLSAAVVDPEDETLTLQWEETSGAAVTFSNPNALETSVEGLEPGSYEFQLTATDPRGASSSASVAVNVVANEAPSVNASASPSSPTTNSSVTLTASASDSDGEVVSYLWSQDDGTSVDLGDTSAASIDLGQLAEGDYQFSVTVTDDFGATASDSVTVSVSTPTPPPSGGGDSGGSGGSFGYAMVLLASLVGLLRRRYSKSL